MSVNHFHSRFVKTIVFFIFFLLFFVTEFIFAQKTTSYKEDIISYQKKYVATHEVVKGKDKKFIHFFEIDESYKVACKFEKYTDSSVISMETTSMPPSKQYFLRYGKISFKLHDSIFQLTLYQPKPIMKDPIYKNYLFLPFIDNTSALESYGSGRYIDLFITEIKNEFVTIDFNKSYNPYCAYSMGFNCPVPPKENFLTTNIKAGEQNFAKGFNH